MCKIIGVINKDKKNNKIINDLLEINAGKLAAEPDGYAVLREDRTFYFLDYQNLISNIKYKNETLYLLHLRLATAGAIGYDGLHLKNINGWYYAHNGTVTKYSKVNDNNDSFYFFKNLILKNNKEITKESVEKEIEKTGFNGRGVLFHPRKKELILFSTNELYVYGLSNCLIFSSFKLETKKTINHYKNVLGLYFIDRVEKKEIQIKKQVLNSVFFRFVNYKLQELEKLKIEIKIKINPFSFYKL